MRFIADFHIHSHFSIATSKNLTPEHLDYWARLKGITVIGTGDFTHPGWIQELKEKLEPAEQGLFKLKKTLAVDPSQVTRHLTGADVRFVLTAEVSCIYKKNGKVRKVHNVIFAPDFETVEKIQHALTRIGGNITSDGRPILGLDSRDLLDIALNASENIFFVPAHIWTPWFSALGAKSGFDTIEECYDDLSDYIHAVETGLSSDPAMNWICSFLDKYTIISNSDAHSPEKLGREANIFTTDLSYDAITDTLRTGDPDRFHGTIEFFPQEGKYHYDGHRKCTILWDPVETLRNNGICTACNKKVTIGVMNRVVQLSDRENPDERKNRHPYTCIIPLPEILSEIVGVGPSSKKIKSLYLEVIKKLGPEFSILLDISPEDIASVGYNELAEAVNRMRNREVIITEGFDGEFGKIKVFQPHERNTFSSQETLFTDSAKPDTTPRTKRKMSNFDLEEYRRLEKKNREQDENDSSKVAEPEPSYNEANPFAHLNNEQRSAAEHGTGPAIVLAGPGTGKTHVLTCRIAALIRDHEVSPENILAVTFTNKASREMKKRLISLSSKKSVVDKVHLSTFHALGFSMLREYHDLFSRTKEFSIIDEDDRRYILQQKTRCDKKRIREISAAITEAKQNLKTVQHIEDPLLAEQFVLYEKVLRQQNIFDLDDLIYKPTLLCNDHSEILTSYQNRFKWILIDEYQDINFAQYYMIKHLVADIGKNLFVIGDPNQAIYGFRGADVAYIRTFIQDYPNAAVYKLKQSYRCSNRILKASGQVISDTAEDRFLEGLHDGVKIAISPQNTDKSEAEFIARTIEEMIGGLRFFSMDSNITEGNRAEEITSLSDFAVLCRIGKQMNAIEKAFHDHSIPYQCVGDTLFFKREPVKTVVQLLKLTMNPQQEMLTEILSTKLSTQSAAITHALEPIRAQKSVKIKINAILDTFFENHNKEQDKPLFNELLDFSAAYKNNTEQFILAADLGSGTDTYKSNVEAVSLMTLHAAKGLEFPCVFIAGCEDGLLPYSILENQRSDYNEEKRLLYVGMTRAQKFLILSYTKRRFIFGREHSLKRSPFLDKIETELLEERKHEYRRKGKEEDLQMSLF